MLDRKHFRVEGRNGKSPNRRNIVNYEEIHAREKRKLANNAITNASLFPFFLLGFSLEFLLLRERRREIQSILREREQRKWRK